MWVVHKHLLLPNLPEGVALPYTFVTALVDKIDFTDLVPTHDADIRLSGHVSWVGRTSIEIVVWMEQKLHGKWRKLTRALFLMVARDATNTKASLINPLVPANDEEKAIFDGGECENAFPTFNFQSNSKPFQLEKSDEFSCKKRICSKLNQTISSKGWCTSCL